VIWMSLRRIRPWQTSQASEGTAAEMPPAGRETRSICSDLPEEAIFRWWAHAETERMSLGIALDEPHPAIRRRPTEPASQLHGADKGSQHILESIAFLVQISASRASSALFPPLDVKFKLL
jgi:hypothetical protein